MRLLRFVGPGRRGRPARGAALGRAPDVEVLARRYRLTPAGLRGVGARAPATPAAAAACARAASRHGLDGLAQPLEAPFGWDDLVVPERLGDALHDLVYEAEARPALWEEPGARRLFPQGRGLLALFHGPPGTGKTMAAQVVAAALGLELLRIDLARVVSKYVGETSQNLDRILTRAAHLDAVLLWDEADALFGRRTEVKDAQDRFANTDTAYLLQAIEDYPGLALLTSNRRANIDPAFVRRLRFVLEFERPDAAARGRLWARLCDELLGADAARALALDLESLARQLELTGAQIKGALLTARLAARRGGAAPTAEHLLRGVERELNKEGRGLSDRDREGLSHGR